MRNEQIPSPVIEMNFYLTFFKIKCLISGFGSIKIVNLNFWSKGEVCRQSTEIAIPNFKASIYLVRLHWQAPHKHTFEKQDRTETAQKRKKEPQLIEVVPQTCIR